MINFNGTIQDNNTVLNANNRGFAYGDALFETIKTSYGKILFWEDHYFRLMASMRILRMEIPMHFNMEFLESKIKNTLEANSLTDASARVKLTVFRNEGGLYLPETNDVTFIIDTKPLQDDFYIISDQVYEVDLFKDFYISPSLLSTLKTNNKVLNVVGSIYAKENNLNNCLILNTNKNVVEALNGNVFVIKGNLIKTAPLSDGCLKGIMRKQLIEIIKAIPEYELIEESISAFELQKADEIFISNTIVGIQPVSKYRKKNFTSHVSKSLIQKLNVKMRLS
ncbi:aminotransferase class IV [Formosa sp. PL04]|uniref:aminotransferase class IV n=1 Tax=Formosa sp. PL04 TaxID=3081755 RepID=UPI002982A99D|nr:aminotransferase class IV [Formosa sp. PL04]MDW5290685.1 aminotransferase class IV [Formosa sp. PL04]